VVEQASRQHRTDDRGDDAAGVEKSVLVQASTCYGHDNSYVADAVAAHPDRFSGVFSADILAPDATSACGTGWARASRHALFTTEQLHARSSRLARRSALLPAGNFAQSAKLPVCLQMTAKAIRNS
jgi:predicted TIM-barrel fold metal-dependent hydrolase